MIVFFYFGKENQVLKLKSLLLTHQDFHFFFVSRSPGCPCWTEMNLLLLTLISFLVAGNCLDLSSLFLRDYVGKVKLSFPNLAF